MISNFTTSACAILLTVLLINQSDAEVRVVQRKTKERLSNKRIEKIKPRHPKIESNPESTKATTMARTMVESTTRYQMLSAGQRVVILDTHTGETKFIEPQLQPAYQNVEVGRAWVVVTVLGNVSERIGLPDDKQ